MALNKSALQSELESIFKEMEDARGSSPKDRVWYAEQLANAINTFVLGVQITPGSMVSPPLPGGYTNANGGTAM